MQLENGRVRFSGYSFAFLLLGIDYSFASYNNYSQFKTLSVSINNSTLRELLKTQ